MSWLTKNLAKLGIGEWMTENFPSADSADNDQSADVIGNKTDTIDSYSCDDIVCYKRNDITYWKNANEDESTY